MALSDMPSRYAQGSAFTSDPANSFTIHTILSLMRSKQQVHIWRRMRTRPITGNVSRTSVKPSLVRKTNHLECITAANITRMEPFWLRSTMFCRKPEILSPFAQLSQERVMCSSLCVKPANDVVCFEDPQTLATKLIAVRRQKS